MRGIYCEKESVWKCYRTCCFQFRIEMDQYC